MIYIAPYITNEEYRCSCCGSLPPYFTYEKYTYDELFRSFETLREKYTKPIPITSGYRCPAYNKEVGGVTYSAHIFGMALDLACDDYEDTTKKKELLLGINPDLRIGLYPDQKFIHIDAAYRIRPRMLEAWKQGVRWGMERL